MRYRRPEYCCIFVVMKIVIAGSGETAGHVARMLSVEGQDVVLVDTDGTALRRLEASDNLLTIEGDPIDISALRHAGASRADIFVAVTPSESRNIISAQLARSLGARRTVARIDSPCLAGAEEALRGTGIDKCIYPERLAAIEAARFLRHNAMSEWLPLDGGKIVVTGATLQQSSPLCGIPLKNAAGENRRFHIVALRRGDDIIIPRGDDIPQAGDHVLFAVLPDEVEQIAALCGAVAVQTRRIMISGAGRVTENLLGIAASRYRITVIDPDGERCRRVAARFPSVAVVCARASNLAALHDEGIEHADAFLALTGSAEANIVACMVARQCGVAKTLARIEELQYMDEAASLSIDKIINKKLINMGAISQSLFDADSMGAQCFSLDYADVVSLRVPEASAMAGKALGDIRFPDGITVAAVIGDDGAHVASGATMVNASDRVVLFCRTGSLGKLRRLGLRTSRL